MDWKTRKSFVEESLKALVLSTELRDIVTNITMYKHEGREGIKVTYDWGPARYIRGVQNTPLCQIAAMVFAESRWMYNNRCDYNGDGSRSKVDDEYSHVTIAGTRSKDAVKIRATYLLKGKKIITEEELLVRSELTLTQILDAYIGGEYTVMYRKCIQGEMVFSPDSNYGFEVDFYDENKEYVGRDCKHFYRSHLVNIELLGRTIDVPLPTIQEDDMQKGGV